MPHTAGLLYEAVYPNRSLFPFGKICDLDWMTHIQRTILLQIRDSFQTKVVSGIVPN